MGIVRLLLVVIVALSASVSGAMDAGHAIAMEHGHMAGETMADDHPDCCSEGSERVQTCHALLALVPVAAHYSFTPASCEDVSFGIGLLLAGINPSGPLDPPRGV